MLKHPECGYVDRALIGISTPIRESRRVESSEVLQLTIYQQNIFCKRITLPRYAKLVHAYCAKRTCLLGRYVYSIRCHNLCMLWFWHCLFPAFCRCVAQRYIRDCFTISGYKFDLRMYVCWLRTLKNVYTQCAVAFTGASFIKASTEFYPDTLYTRPSPALGDHER